MTAAEVKDALRRRHPGGWQGGLVGEWTTLEEFVPGGWHAGTAGIDLLAISAWASHGYRRVGYEVKVSRSDFRRELEKPGKRARAVAFCHEFWLAIPVGLLTVAEVASRHEHVPGQLWVPPDVGLVEVASIGVRVAHAAPRRYATEEERRADHQLAILARHASARPDPRHRRP